MVNINRTSNTVRINNVHCQCQIFDVMLRLLMNRIVTEFFSSSCIKTGPGPTVNSVPT